MRIMMVVVVMVGGDNGKVLFDNIINFVSFKYYHQFCLIQVLILDSMFDGLIDWFGCLGCCLCPGKIFCSFGSLEWP